VLVERSPVVGPELGPGPRAVIEDALDELGIEVRLETTVTALDDGVVRLSDATVLPAQTVVWAAGMQASPITRSVPGHRDALGRLEVDRFFRVIGVDGVLAAGDTASIEVAPGQRALQACQYAHQMGKHAGHNAVCDLLDLPLVEFMPEPYVTCLDLGAAGAVYTAAETLLIGTPPGYGALMVAVLLLSGVQLLILGIVGEYLGRLYLTVNGKPQAIVKTVERNERAGGTASAPVARLAERA
jgi:NADH dehydrogenase FAD-containing subunit